MTGKTTAQRQAEFYRRQVAKGLKLVKVWVRADMVPELRKLAARLK